MDAAANGAADLPFRGLSALAKHGRYRKAIVEDARLRLEEML